MLRVSLCKMGLDRGLARASMVQRDFFDCLNSWHYLHWEEHKAESRVHYCFTSRVVLKNGSLMLPLFECRACL
jgi:hypothetical protein